MKFTSICLGTVGLTFLVLRASSATLYVDLTSTNPVSPYAGWTTAATNIQDAIDVASDGDQIWVTNGIYQTGGRVMAGSLTNRVALNKAVTVQSVNGPWVTVIQGWRTNMSNPAATRCAWLTNNAALIGFTLRGGATQTSGDTSGGGVWCASSNALVANCVIVSNLAYIYGGGAYQGTLENCLIWSNSVSGGSGGGVCNAVLLNCTVISNANGGIYQTAPNLVRATNCIIYYNGGANYGGAPITFAYCCTTPGATGIGNFTNAPQLFVDGVHLTSTSPCVGAGTNVVNGTDIFGKAWANPPSVGCAEFDPSPSVTSPQIQLTGDPVGFTVGGAAIAGQPPFMCWWLKDSVPLQDNGHFNFTQTTNLVAIGVNFADAGGYQLVVSNAVGVVTSAVAQLVVHCVDVSGTNPVAPYSTWATAATNIQDAISASVAGDIVLVTNGVYATGGKSMDGVITNRVSVDKAIIVQSVNGRCATVIQGTWDPILINGPGAVRCAWLTTNAVLSGFTIRGGATRGDITSYQQGTPAAGGGVFGISTSTVANCAVISNAAAAAGGGAVGVTLINCQLMGNKVLGVPGYGVSAVGGGANSCNLKNCLVTGNYALSGTPSGGQGGGTAYGLLKNCAVTGNFAGQEAGGVYYGTLINCTVTMNSAGGASYANLTNCIVFANRQAYSNYFSCTFSFSCASPLPAGVGNTNVDPQLLADGFHLAMTSPCIGAGTTNALSGTDIDGQPWTNPPSIGCDEWWPMPVIAVQPNFQVGTAPHTLNFNTSAAGQTPFAYWWSKDGVPIHDDSHNSSSSTANLTVNDFDAPDAGGYQVVVSNSFGLATSQLVQVVIHCADAAGINPTSPYSTWATAATTIQDAVNVASSGEIVLVTNGIYVSGGKVMAGDLTNRVALDKALTVMSESGYAVTVIQGAWDPVTTNGPLAVRCAWLTNGATLSGFTLQGGATRSTGDYNSLRSGGGLWCASVNSTNPLPNFCRNCLIRGNSAANYGGGSSGGDLFNCLLTNNSAIDGGGIAFGTINNSLVAYNVATYGGGAYNAALNSCTVVNNYSTAPFNGGSVYGGGTYGCVVRNSIVVNNSDSWPYPLGIDNYSSSTYSYSCTWPLPSGAGNIDANSVNPQLLDQCHIASTSPCRGAGSALYTSGTDLDGEAWANPPSMGCDEVVISNLVGPLSVGLFAYQTNLLVSPPGLLYPHIGYFQGIINGRAASVTWSFGDGPVITNSGAAKSHQWTNTGDYTVVFTAYNNDNPDGVATNTVIHVVLPDVPQLQPPALTTNGFQFQFAGQLNADYTVQYATNLTPPVDWQTLNTFGPNFIDLIQINDPATNTARFYRVLAQ